MKKDQDFDELDETDMLSDNLSKALEKEGIEFEKFINGGHQE